MFINEIINRIMMRNVYRMGEKHAIMLYFAFLAARNVPVKDVVAALLLLFC